MEFIEGVVTGLTLASVFVLVVCVVASGPLR